MSKTIKSLGDGWFMVKSLTTGVDFHCSSFNEALDVDSANYMTPGTYYHPVKNQIIVLNKEDSHQGEILSYDWGRADRPHTLELRYPEAFGYVRIGDV